MGPCDTCNDLTRTIQPVLGALCLLPRITWSWCYCQKEHNPGGTGLVGRRRQMDGEKSQQAESRGRQPWAAELGTCKVWCVDVVT